MKAKFDYNGTLDEALLEHSGQEVVVKRSLDDSEVEQVSDDPAHRIIMYEVEFPDGFMAHVFDDELTHIS